MKYLILPFFSMLFLSIASLGGTESGVSGTVVDNDDVAVSSAAVEITSIDGRVKRAVTTSLTGEFLAFPLDFGLYQVVVSAAGFVPYKTTTALSSGTTAQMSIHLQKTDSKEIVVNVKEKKNLVQISSSGSKKDFDKEQISAMPEGDDISLQKLISTTNPGVIAGPFGQIFIRGNHANVQYQIDGVQLPESSSGSFGEAFSPRNVDHMEVITGGIPAEYGERLSAVVNVITKAGTEKTSGDAEVSYGSYNTVTPLLQLSGSSKEGNIHYYTSLKYNSTSRGLDTPQPASYADQSHGGQDAIHDNSHSDEEFLRVDDVLNNTNKVTMTAFNSTRFYQIPNYPSSFQSTDAYFQPGYQDSFGNNGAANPTFNYTPSGTNDAQTEQDSFLQMVWKRTLSDTSFLQVAPYYKRSSLGVTNDLSNDLSTTSGGANPIANSQADSFVISRVTNNYGLKSDYTLRANDKNLVKAGLQYQYSQSLTNPMSIWTSLSSAPATFTGTDTGQLAALYLQDSYAMTSNLTWNLGLRLSGTQFQSDGVYSTDGMLQPRLGLEYLINEKTKVHAYYGKLFQPAPFENLREAFTVVGGGQLTPYDIKAEKDDYYEAGVTRQVGESHAVSLVYYYKNATNMIDDAALLNTSIAQPYNFATGYANGVELGLNGDISNNLSDFFNYSYEDARGQGISGGIFTGVTPSTSYQFLDHVQLNTANAGITYKRNSYWTTIDGLYGSGLRTGPNNGTSLPSHLTFDLTVGYKFSESADWFSGMHTAVDWLNITNNAYPITIANGFNGSHYAAGMEFRVHLGKEF